MRRLIILWPLLYLGEAKDIFRDTGGLQSVLDTVTTTKYSEVTEAGLYCLGSAVEKNGELFWYRWYILLNKTGV